MGYYERFNAFQAFLEHEETGHSIPTTVVLKVRGGDYNCAGFHY